MLKFIIFLLLISIYSCSSSGNGGSASGEIISGKVSWDYWKAHSSWALHSYYVYEPDYDQVIILKDLLSNKNYHFTIFATNSCDECSLNIPVAFKLFELAEIPMDRISLYGLDENLEEPSGAWEKYNIPSPPVIYLEIDGKITGEAEYPYMWLNNFIEILEAYEKDN